MRDVVLISTARYECTSTAREPCAIGCSEVLIGQLKARVTMANVPHNMQQAARDWERTQQCAIGEFG